MRKSTALLIIALAQEILFFTSKKDVHFITLMIIIAGYFIVKQLEENKNK